MLPFSCRRCWFALIMCAVWFTCTSQSFERVMKNSDGDDFTIRYTVSHPDGKIVVSFDHVTDIQLGDKNKNKYAQKQDKGLVRAIFMDGNNFNEEEIEIKIENNVSKWSEFTTPASWKYDNQDKSNVFCLNDRNCHPEFSFTGNRDQAILKIPIYLAYITSDTKRNWVVKKKGVVTSYHIFSEFEPLEIKLTMPKATPSASDRKPNPGKTMEVKVVDDSVVIDPESGSSLDLNQPDLDAKSLIHEIQREMDNGSGLTDYEAKDFYDQLKPRIERLEKLKNAASKEVQQDIDDLVETYNEKIKKAIEQINVISKHDGYVLGELDKLDHQLDSCAWRRLGLIDDIEKVYQGICQEYKDKVSPTVQHDLTDFNQKIIAKKKELKPYLIIRNILLGLLGFITMAVSFLGYSRWKNNLEQKKMKSFETMQQQMVRRAEREAERRARGYTQNKTRQVIGQARNKGRQAAQSKAQEVANRVRGQKPSSADNPATGGSRANDGNSRPPIGRFSGKKNLPNRRPKPGENGEISI